MKRMCTPSKSDVMTDRILILRLLLVFVAASQLQGTFAYLVAFGDSYSDDGSGANVAVQTALNTTQVIQHCVVRGSSDCRFQRRRQRRAGRQRVLSSRAVLSGPLLERSNLLGNGSLKRGRYPPQLCNGSCSHWRSWILKYFAGISAVRRVVASGQCRSADWLTTGMSLECKTAGYKPLPANADLFKVIRNSGCRCYE